MISLFNVPVSKTAKAFGVEYAELYYDGEIAVWEIGYLKQPDAITPIFTLANPTDLWDARLRYKEKAPSIASEEDALPYLKKAKKVWERVRAFAQVMGIEWLDVPYSFLVRHDVSVHVRTSDLYLSEVMNFAIHGDEGVVITPGEFIANLLRDDFKQIDLNTLHASVCDNEKIAYIDFACNTGRLIEDFINNPERFDGGRGRGKTFLLFHKGKWVLRFEDGSIYIEPDETLGNRPNDGIWATGNLRVPPIGCPSFPYATWHAKRDAIEVMMSNNEVG